MNSPITQALIDAHNKFLQTLDGKKCRDKNGVILNIIAGEYFHVGPDYYNNCKTSIENGKIINETCGELGTILSDDKSEALDRVRVLEEELAKLKKIIEE